MLIEINYEEMKGARVKGFKDGKSKALIPLVICDNTNIADACIKYGTSKHKVPIKFLGDVDILPHMVIDTNYIIVERAIPDIDLSIDLEIRQIDPRVTIVFVLPDDFTNIKAVYDTCQKYPNVRFVGGNLALIKGVRIGLIDLNDFTTKDITKLGIVTDGFKGYAPLFYKDDFDEIEFTHKDKPLTIKKAPRAKVERTDKPKKERTTKPKKEKTPSLFAEFI